MAPKKYIGVDLFAGAGGMSVGASMSGVDVKVAVEIDRHAATTYQANHTNTIMINSDIRKFNIKKYRAKEKNTVSILFGGPPCQGFSTANQKTRNKGNSHNWLFQEFIRVTKEYSPDWVIVENVKGIIETEGGYFFEKIMLSLSKLGYLTNSVVLNAKDYNVPQIRNRVFIVGSLHGVSFQFPKPETKVQITVKDAISDLPELNNGAYHLELDYRTRPQSRYQANQRHRSKKSLNNIVSHNNELVIERYRHIPQGANWEAIPPSLMKNYANFSRCHSRIYYRLKDDEPSVVIGNYRKNMLIHPKEDRGLSVREAARLQSFPDSFRFYGSIGFQQQQVANSVPPRLAQAVFNQIMTY